MLTPSRNYTVSKTKRLIFTCNSQTYKITRKRRHNKQKKIGRVNFLTLNKKSLQGLQTWTNQFQTHWGNDHETLENYAQYLGNK
jgi:hypothetical protein